MTVAQRQTQEARDIAHHQARIEWLEGKNPKWVCGTPVSPSDRAQMLRASRNVIAQPIQGFNTGPQA